MEGLGLSGRALHPHHLGPNACGGRYLGRYHHVRVHHSWRVSPDLHVLPMSSRRTGRESFCLLFQYNNDPQEWASLPLSTVERRNFRRWLASLYRDAPLFV